MKQAVQRKTLTGAWAEFKFSRKGRFFVVKNLSDSDALVSFLNDEVEDEAIKIKAGATEKCAISFDPIDRKEYQTDTVFVKGTGEVEVQAIDICKTIDEPTVANGVLVLAEQDTVEGDAVTVKNADFDGDTMII